MRLALWLVQAALVTVTPALAQTPAEFFERKIRPVLVEKCHACHSASAPAVMGGLRIDTRDGLRKAVEGRLLKAISYTDPALRMPPTGKLDPEVIEDFRRWIDMGAPDPRAGTTETPKSGIDWTEARKFWAFQPVRKQAIPAVKRLEWVKTSVDAFILARLEAAGVDPAPFAAQADWLRRVTFDLTGLPPTPGEIAGFLADTSRQAFERVVERLLASPHYGERWGRHWLDLVRFAETNGHEFDNNKLDAWRYRDYVIRAFNQDLPYDQFVREHIAGDLIPRQRQSPDGSFFESPLGTGFLWFGEVLNSATDSVKTRADTVDNQIDVLGKTFLGLTIACARCHDHKFDPIAASDYYALAGVFHSTYVREEVLDTPERQAGIRLARASVAAPGLSHPGTARLRAGDTAFEDFAGYQHWNVTGEAFAPGPSGGAASSAGALELVGSLTSRKFRMPKLWVHVRLAGTRSEARLKETAPVRVTVVADDHKSEHIVPTGKAGWEWRSSRMTKEIGRECFIEIVDRDRQGWLAVDQIVLSDDPKPPESTAAASFTDAAPRAPVPESAWGMITRDENPRNTRLHLRGDHKNLGEEVPRGFMKLFTAGDASVSGSGRREVAGWIATEKNPLLARVMVNRIWKHHFGQGIVRTPDNFGRTGDRPTHPELLDWLAAEFVESGWSVKAMHRLMVLSNAYRMSSRAQESAVKADPRNDLLHHMPVRRLEGEAVRDAILAVSGGLDRTLYGPGVMPHISPYQDGRGKPGAPGPLDGAGRRSIYIQVRRNFLTPMLLAFDYPLPVSTAGARGSSTVPAQALMMLNNEFVAAQAERWSARVIAREDGARRVEVMFVEVFGRPPEAWETRESLEYVARQGGAARAWADLAHVLFNSAEMIYVR